MLTKEKIIKIIKSKNICDFERPNCDPTVIATGEGRVQSRQYVR